VAANNITGSHPIKFSVVRYSNVMGSRGSVIPFFMERQKTGMLPITDKRMTRFNITLQQGVDFVLQCLEKTWGGELFVPKIPSFRITDVAEAINSECKLEIVAIRPGEKLHEEMITTTDVVNTVEFDDYYVILPTTKLSWDIKKFIQESNGDPGKMVSEDSCYNSATNKKNLSVKKIRSLIKSELNA
jgi:UDP-N-acetylglucosamine 4,6-dehydratase